MLTPTMSKNEAAHIIARARKMTTIGPVSDNYDKCMSREQRQRILDFWDKLPGTSTFESALNCLAKGVDYQGHPMQRYEDHEGWRNVHTWAVNVSVINDAKHYARWKEEVPALLKGVEDINEMARRCELWYRPLRHWQKEIASYAQYSKVNWIEIAECWSGADFPKGE